MPPTVDTISAHQLCRLAGCTYRQADYWSRTGLLVAAVPARGSGSRRGFDREEVVVARAITRLSALGAQGEPLHRAAASIRAAVEVGLAGERVYVDCEGRVSFQEPLDDGWTIRLDDDLDDVEP